MLDKDTKYALDILNMNNSLQIKRLWIALFILIFLLVGSNISWLIYENSFEDIVMEQTVSSDGAGNVALNGVGTGELNYYGSESDTENKD